MKNTFKFKGFTIDQHEGVHKVGTDGVLLGAWVDLRPTDSTILDVGTGTGLIALMLAQRSNARITGIDPDPIAVEVASCNTLNSPFADRIFILKSSLQNFEPGFKFDHLVVNPPFFENQLKSPSKTRNRQRHTDSLPFEELITGAKKCLQPMGRLSVIIPMEAGKKLTSLADSNGFFITRMTEVISKPGKTPMRLLITFETITSKSLSNKIILEDGKGHRSAQYEELTRSFYL